MEILLNLAKLNDFRKINLFEPLNEQHVHTYISSSALVGCSPFSRSVGAYWFEVGVHVWEVVVILIRVGTPLMVKSWNLGSGSDDVILVLQRSFLSLWEWSLVVALVSRCIGSCSVL